MDGIRRPRTRRRLLIAALLIVLLFGIPTAFVAWVNSGDGATSAANPSPSATTQPPPAEQTTPAQTPPSEEATPKPLPVTGVVTGSCSPSGDIGYVCTPSGTVTASEDGFVRGTRDGQYLLIECRQDCSATDVPKAQLPCVKGIGSMVFCARVDDRERAFRAMQTLTYLCSRDDNVVACKKRDNITVVEGGLHINSLPAVLATSSKGVLGAYIAQVPAGFKSYGSCTEGTGTIECTSPVDSIAPVGLNCTPGQTTVTCIEPVGRMQETEVTVWCPGSDSTVYCLTREGGMYSNRVDCTLNTADGRKFVCRKGETA